MTTALITHPDCQRHVTPDGHPERVERLRAIDDRLSAPEFDPLLRIMAPLAGDDQITRCHPQAYIDRINATLPQAGEVPLDADTWLSPGSVQAARRGVGGVIAAIDTVTTGAATNAFVACRPPGHHAETAKPMGFCLFGNVAIGAKYALDELGLGRVAVIDFDVHHGNGTQDLLWEEARLLFTSSHQSPLWPGTGDRHECGASNNVMNVPLRPYSGSTEMRAAYDEVVFPAVEVFAPELILVSAGFDAHMADPLAQLNWTTDDFAWLTRRICDLAARHCGGKVVSTLEGGYDLSALADSVAAHIGVLMEQGQ